MELLYAGDLVLVAETGFADGKVVDMEEGHGIERFKSECWKYEGHEV